MGRLPVRFQETENLIVLGLPYFNGLVAPFRHTNFQSECSFVHLTKRKFCLFIIPEKKNQFPLNRTLKNNPLSPRSSNNVIVLSQRKKTIIDKNLRRISVIQEPIEPLKINKFCTLGHIQY